MLVRPSTRTVIMLWYMKGCGHCDEFKPRFRALAREYQEIFVAQRVQILELDAAAPALQATADHFGVKFTPTTIAAQRGSEITIRLDGNVSDVKIRHLLDTVAGA